MEAHTGSTTYPATIAYCCLGYNRPQDAIYPSVATDGEGQS
jgi:hypothetical protein